MSTYIVEALVTGKVYYDIEAESEKDAIKIAHKENANKKIYTEDGTDIELSVCDDIDTFTVVEKQINKNEFINNMDKYFDLVASGKNVKVNTENGNVILLTEKEFNEILNRS